MHLFADPVGAFAAADVRPFVFRNRQYLGYSVLRPVPAAPVGRDFPRPNVARRSPDDSHDQRLSTSLPGSRTPLISRS